MNFPPSRLTHLVCLAALALTGCGDSRQQPSTATATKALAATLPPSLELEKIEWDITPGGEKPARLRYRGAVRAREELFERYEGNPLEAVPELARCEEALRELAELELYDTRRDFLPVDFKATPLDARYQKLRDKLQGMGQNLLAKAAPPGRSFPIQGTATGTYEFKKWEIRGLTTGGLANIIGKPRSSFPPEALVIQAPEVSKAIDAYVAESKELEDAQEQALAAKK